MAEELYAGVDVGGTHVRMGIVGPGGELRRESMVPTAALASGAPAGVDRAGTGSDRAQASGTPARLLDAIAEFVGTESVAAMCIGFPSVVSKDRRVVVQTPNVPGLDRVPMAELAAARFKFPVYIEKDVNLLLVHDVASLGLSGPETVLGFYLGTGLGNAIMIGGRVYTGAMGAAGELGHIPALGLGLVCSCGNVGCVEMIASGKALAAHSARAYPGTPIGDYFRLHGDDPFIAEFIDALAIAVATEVNILDPAAAIFGGGLVHMASFPREFFVERVRARLRPPYPKESVKILFSTESRNSGVLGAAEEARTRSGRVG